MGQNDGGIKRGDRADTGDLEAQPTTSSAENSGGRVNDKQFHGSDPNSFPIGGLSDLTVKAARDPTLGMTNVSEKPADDWAANTGPTRSPEGELNVATREQRDDGSTLVEDHHVRERSPEEGDFPIADAEPQQESPQEVKEAPAKRSTTTKKRKAG